MSEVGATFAGYRLEQLLSTDTVSSIYRASPDAPPGVIARPVSLRVTHALCVADAPDAEAIATYIRSVSAAVKVSHPALVPIADAGERYDRVYVATALVDGVTLERYVRDHGRLAPDDAVALLRDLAEALDRAHAAGVFHGAISPRTIRIRRTDGGTPVAVLQGFGIDTLLARQARVDRGAIDIADVAYVAPEHLRSTTLDGRADQYSLACALFHCVAGHPPFLRDTAAGLFGAHLFSTVMLNGVAGDDDQALTGALLAGMDKRPDQRHASCVDLLRATGHLHASRSASSTVGSASDTSGVAWPEQADPLDGVSQPPPRHPARGRRARRRRRARASRPVWPVAAMAVLLGIVSALAFVTIMRGRDLGVAARIVDAGGPIVAGSLATTDDEPAAAGVHWQRTVADEPVYDVQIIDGLVIAAAPHRVLGLAPGGGRTVWTVPIDVGVLTDLVATDDVVALRAAKFRAIASNDGAPLWERADIVAPINALAAARGTVYGIGVGRLAPELQALDAGTGAQLWSYDGGGERIDDGASVVAHDGMIALLDSDWLWVLDPGGPTAAATDVGVPAAGGARWHVAVHEPWLDSLAVLPDVVVIATQTGDVCAHDPIDGELRWCEPVAGLDAAAPTIVAVGDTIAVVGTDVTALAIETGARRWTFDAPRDLTPIAASTDRQVVVTDVDGQAHGLDLATGFEVWRASGFGKITALAAADDAVYAGTRAGTLLRVRLPVTDTQS